MLLILKVLSYYYQCLVLRLRVTLLAKYNQTSVISSLSRDENVTEANRVWFAALSGNNFIFIRVVNIIR